MKKLLFIYLLYMLVANGVLSQNYYITNLYMYDMFVMNPANAGSDKSCFDLGVFYQNQWLGMDESPTTQIVNAQGPLSKNMGFGSYIYHDRNGNMNSLGIHQSISYKVQLKNTQKNISFLSFGLAFSLEEAFIDERNFTNRRAVIDPLIDGGITKGIGYNANAGIIYKYNDYQLGLSATNLFNQTNPLYLGQDEPELPTDVHLFLTSLYKVTGRDVFLEPLLMYRWNSFLEKRLDITMRGIFPTYKPEYALWGLISYRREMDNEVGKSIGLAATIGVNYRRISFGIEYQLGLTEAQIEYGSAYQLILKYSICNLLKHHAIPCSEARKNKRSRYDGVIWY